MRVTTLAVLASSLTLLACGGAEQPKAQSPSNGAPGTNVSAAPATTGADVASMKVADDSGKADKVGGSDGALKADGAPDLSFVADVTGPATALFLVSVNAKGDLTGEYQADTVTGLDQLPKNFPIAVRAGMLTAGIGVWENDKLVSKPDGTVELGPGPHRITMYVASTGVLQPGSSFVRLYMLRPDKSVVMGPVTKL